MASSKAGHGGVPQKAPGPPGFPAVNSFTNAEYMIAFPFGLVALALLFATAKLTNMQPFLKNLAFLKKSGFVMTQRRGGRFARNSMDSRTSDQIPRDSGPCTLGQGPCDLARKLKPILAPILKMITFTS